MRYQTIQMLVIVRGPFPLVKNRALFGLVFFVTPVYPSSHVLQVEYVSLKGEFYLHFLAIFHIQKLLEKKYLDVPGRKLGSMVRINGLFHVTYL